MNATAPDSMSSSPFPTGHSSLPVVPIIGGGEMGQRVRDTDWSATPLGDYPTWPQSLRSSLSLVLNAKGIAALYWGQDQWLLYNDAYGVALGDRHPSAFGHPMPEVLTDIAPVLGPQVAEVLRTGNGFAIESLPMTMRRHGRDEETIWTYSFSPVQGEEGGFAGVLLLATERTEQVLAERARDVARARINEMNWSLTRQVAERTADRDALWQLSRDLMLRCTFEGVMTAINPAWTNILGWREDELLGTNLFTLIHPDDMARTVKGASQLSEGTGHARFDNRYRHRDGSYRWISWSTQPSEGLINAVGRDFTVEKQQAEALQDFEDFARLALTSVGGVGVWTFDVASERFTCDVAISELYGLDVARGAAGVPSQEFLSNVHPEDMAKLRTVMAGGLLNSGDLELEYRLRHPDGSVRWVLSRGHTYFDDAGKPVRRTGVGIETTKQRQLEEALRQSQKMEAVGQLTGGLAHDFNNLLAGISGSLEMIQSRLRQGRLGDVEKYVAAAQSGSKRAASLTHRLLAFSRRQTLDPKPTDVNRLVLDMHDLVQRTVGPGIMVEVVGASNLWPALIDASQLENAVLNLCINARDAMPDGGRITIETANRWLDAKTARQQDMPEGQYLSVCVTDTGTGMPPEVIDRVFEPFFTTKPIGEGTGLGLSMIYGFAKQSGGQVRIYSEVGLGSTICIYLPRHYGTIEDELALQAKDTLEQADGGKTILVVDDEPLVRMLAVDVLEELGYTVIEASDSASSLRILQSDALIDLLVSDVGLPGGMNGRQMADAARLVRPDLKVLFVTGYAENAVVGNGNLTTGMAVVTKPFDLDALAAKVQAMIET